MNLGDKLRIVGEALGLTNRAVRLLVERAPSPCWSWAGRRYKGRARFSGVGGSEINVARAVLRSKLGRPIREGHDADHACKNPACVNPAHLRELPKVENVARNRVRLCDRGHELTPENVSPTGGKKLDGSRGRTCRRCLLARKARYRAAAVRPG